MIPEFPNSRTYGEDRPSRTAGNVLRSLKSKAAIVVALVFVAIMALTATVQTRFIRADLLRDIGNTQSALVERAARELDKKLEMALLGLSREAGAVPAAAVSDRSAIQSYLEEQPTLLLLFDGLFITTPDGRVAAAVPEVPGLRDSSTAEREYFKRTIETRAPVISKPYVGRNSGRPFIAMTAPIVNSKGELVGVLGGYLDLLTANFLGGLASTSIGTKGNFFVISKSEPPIYVIHPNPDLVMKPSNSGGPVAANLQALQGYEGTLEAPDVTGAASLVSYKGLKRADWILGASYPAAEAFAPVTAAERRLWLITGISTLVLAPLIWILTSLMLAPLRRLDLDVQSLHREPGDSDQHGTISGALLQRRDEIGHLANEFNALVIRQKEAVEALRRSQQLLDNIVENIPAAVQLKDVNDDLRIVMWNRAAEQMFGIPRERAIGRTIHENWSAQQAKEFHEADLRAIEDGEQEFSHRAITNARGEHLIGHVRKVVLRDAATITYLLVIMDDITQRVTDEDELRNNRAFLKTLVENAPVAIYVKDVRPGTYGTMVVWNRRIEAITNMLEKDVIGRKDSDFLDPVVLAEMQKRDREMFANPVIHEVDDDPFRRRDGTLIFLHTISVPLLGEDGKPEFIMRISEDVTARRRQRKDLQARTAELLAMSEALQSSEHRLRTFTDTMPASIAYIDSHEIYQFTNAAFERAVERVYGRGEQEVRGRSIRDVVGDEVHAKLKPYIERVLAGENVTFDRERPEPDGTRWVESTYIPELNEDGDEVIGFHVMIQDVTVKKTEQLRLLRLAQLDSLTGLANRVGFEQRLTDAMSASRESGEPLALMYVDIDRFKQINDTHGHAVGDTLLIEFGHRLKLLMRKSDIIARLGGDEFVIVTERVLDPAIATRLAAKALDEIRRPFPIADTQLFLHVSASIGIAFYVGSSVTAEQLLSQADAMLYAAKNGGRNQYLVAPWPCSESRVTPGPAGP